MFLIKKHNIISKYIYVIINKYLNINEIQILSETDSLYNYKATQ